MSGPQRVVFNTSTLIRAALRAGLVPHRALGIVSCRSDQKPARLADRLVFNARCRYEKTPG